MPLSQLLPTTSPKNWVGPHQIRNRGKQPMTSIEFAPGRIAKTRAGLASTIAASTIGTIVEWYDFLLYATAAALIFNKLFFPQFDPVAGTIASFAAYAVGFLVRPIGGIVFGWLGD